MNMNKKASNIIKSLLLASVISISGNDVEDTSDYTYTLGNDKDEQTIASKRKSVIKNVIKLNGKELIIKVMKLINDNIKIDLKNN